MSTPSKKRRKPPCPKKKKAASDKIKKEFASAMPPKGQTLSATNDRKDHPLTMQQEMALAIILWRAARFHYRSLSTLLTNNPLVGKDPGVMSIWAINDQEVNETAIEMAKRMGVVKEFWDWLFEFPSWKLFVAGLDPWPTRLKHLVPPDRETVVVSPPLPNRDD